jgi:hypothetical protein
MDRLPPLHETIEPKLQYLADFQSDIQIASSDVHRSVAHVLPKPNGTASIAQSADIPRGAMRKIIYLQIGIENFGRTIHGTMAGRGTGAVWFWTNLGRASPSSAKRRPASAQAMIQGPIASGSPTQIASIIAAFAAFAQAEIGAAIGFLSGAHMLPPDHAAASASQVVAAR